MKMLSKKLINRKRTEHTYEVLIDEWKNTPENLATVYNYCDSWNYGGFLSGIKKVGNGYILTVDVFID